MNAWKAAALYAALTVVFAYPLSLHPGTTVFGDNPDTHFYMWTLGWDAHAFLHQPLHMFDANIYYPNRLTLAYSENQIGSALFAAPILWLTGNPVLAMNLVALLGCVLCGVGAYVLGRRIGLDALAATICGLVFAFAPARFVRTGQAYLGTVQWIPFTLAALHSYFDRGTKWSLRWAAALFSLQALTSGHAAVFLTLAAASLVLYRLVCGEPLAIRQRLRDLGVPGVLWLLPTLLVYLPYRRVQLEMGLRRSLQDWAPTHVSFLAAPTHLQQWVLSWMPNLHVNETAGAYLFPGYTPVLLATIAVIAAKKRTKTFPTPFSAVALLADVVAVAGLIAGLLVIVRGPLRIRLGDAPLISVRDTLRPLIIAGLAIALRIAMARTVKFEVTPRIDRVRRWWREATPTWRRDPTMLYAWLVLIGVWMSIGPPIGLWPLIYWLPGFSFIRLSSRFMTLAMIGLAVLAGIGFQYFLSRVRPDRRKWLTTAMVLLMIGEFAGMPLPVTPYAVTIPAIDRWLATQPVPFVVAEFPASSVVRYQTTYMLHSTVHWQKTVHGYSGFEAPLHTRLYQELRGFPDELSLQRLSDLGVTYMVVHEDLYRQGDWLDVESRLQRFGDRLSLEHVEAAGRIYSLRRIQPPSGSPVPR